MPKVQKMYWTAIGGGYDLYVVTDIGLFTSRIINAADISDFEGTLKVAGNEFRFYLDHSPKTTALCIYPLSLSATGVAP